MEITKSNNSKQTLLYVCAGLFALSALIHMIYVVIRIKEINEYYGDYDTPEFVVILFVIGLAVVMIGSGLTAYFMFTKNDAKIGHIILAAGFIILFLEQLISMVQYMQVAYGSYYDGFWFFNIGTFLTDLIMACVFVVYFAVPSLTGLDKKTMGIVLMVAPAVAFLAMLISGAGEDITLYFLQPLRMIAICGAAALLPIVNGYVSFGGTAVPAAPNAVSAIKQETEQNTHQATVQASKNVKKSEPTSNDFELVKQYKQMLDEGILSEEQFDSLKKELLNL